MLERLPGSNERIAVTFVERPQRSDAANAFGDDEDDVQ